jgi:hypothetical protein
MSNTSPDHYKGEIECIAAIKASMSHQQYLGYLKGNAMKYLWRYDRKKRGGRFAESQSIFGVAY